jgi:uncharacterized protein with HEPN domain
MARKVTAALKDILAAIAGIEAALVSMDRESFKRNWVVYHAVQRGLEIISEASRRIPDEIAARHPTIPWRQVRDIGNVLRHAYHGLDDTVIWAVAHEDLPALKQAVAAMLAEQPD